MNAFARMNRGQEEKEKQIQVLEGIDDREPGGLSEVNSTHRFVLHEHKMLIKSSFFVSMPRLNMHLITSLDHGTYTFTSAIEFQGDISRLPVVHHFMELGFQEAAKRYGHRLLSEMQTREVKPLAMAAPYALAL